MNTEGNLIWITGLSGAGKTTVARILKNRCATLYGITPILFDGDNLRAILKQEHNFDYDSRLKLAKTYGRLCKELVDQNQFVICSTISLFHEVHQWNRSNIKNYTEVFLKVPVQELVRRDSKGIYKNIKTNIAGIDLTVEEPLKPDLVIENYKTNTPEDSASRILKTIEQHNKYLAK